MNLNKAGLEREMRRDRNSAEKALKVLRRRPFFIHCHISLFLRAGLATTPRMAEQKGGATLQVQRMNHLAIERLASPKAPLKLDYRSILMVCFASTPTD